MWCLNDIQILFKEMAQLDYGETMQGLSLFAQQRY